MNRWPWGVVAALVAMVVAIAWLAPPAVLPGEAPSEVISGGRALEALARVVGDEPHPVGTPANRRVERRLVAELAALGLAPRVSEGVICAEHCARVRNLLVTVPGREPGARPTLVSTHYDSVASGPGAGDAGAAVGAMLELARLLAAHPLRRPVELLFNEGEEAGLLGAQVFLRDHRAEDYTAVVNLEARGTGGNAFLFELRGDQGAWARRYGAHAIRPSVSSLYTAIYALLPNNTDVTVYGDAGFPAANVAFLGGGVRYHTPLDDLEQLQPGSVQHLADQALSLVRALDGEVEDLKGDARAVFWDLRFVVWVLPVWVLRLGCAGGTLTAMIALWRVPWPPGSGRYAVSLVSAPCLGALVGAGLQASAGGWYGYPVVGLMLVWVAVVALAQLAPVLPFGARFPWLLAAVWLGGLGTVVAMVLPEGSYLCAQPLLLLLLAAALPPMWRPVAGGLAALPLWHLAMGLVPALGVFGAVCGGVFALAFTPLWMGCRLPRWRWLPVVGVVGLWSLTWWLPDHTSTRPRGLMALHLTDGDTATLQVHTARFPVPSTDDPWPERASATAPLRAYRRVLEARPSDRPAATLTAIEPTGRGYRATVHAPGSTGLYVRGTRVEVEGAAASPFHWKGAADGLELEFDSDRFEIYAIYPGLPEPLPEGFVPIHSGVESWVLRRVRLGREGVLDEHEAHGPQ